MVPKVDLLKLFSLTNLYLTDLHSKWSILLLSESKCAYSGTYNLDTSVFMPSDSSMTRRCEYLSNMHYIDHIGLYLWTWTDYFSFFLL